MMRWRQGWRAQAERAGAKDECPQGRTPTPLGDSVYDNLTGRCANQLTCRASAERTSAGTSPKSVRPIKYPATDLIASAPCVHGEGASDHSSARALLGSIGFKVSLSARIMYQPVRLHATWRITDLVVSSSRKSDRVVSQSFAISM